MSFQKAVYNGIENRITLREEISMYCKECGTKNIDNSNFCESCGAKLIKPRRNTESNRQYERQRNRQPYKPQPKSKPNKAPLTIGLLLVLIVGIIALAFLFRNGSEDIAYSMVEPEEPATDITEPNNPALVEDEQPLADVMEFEPPASAENEATIQEEMIEEISEMRLYTLDEARRSYEQSGMWLWIKDTDNLFRPALTNKIEHNKTGLGHVVFNEYTGISSNMSEYPVLNLQNRDQLVTFKSLNSLEFYEVLESGYAHEGIFQIFSENARLRYERGRAQYIDTINGFYVVQEENYIRDDSDRRLHLKGADVGLIPACSTFRTYYITGDLGERISIGYFEGTQFIEIDIYISHRFYFYGIHDLMTGEGTRRYIAPVETTREGYFFVNMDGVGSSGLYAIGSRTTGRNYIIEVRY